jgi:hypothetical protein
MDRDIADSQGGFGMHAPTLMSLIQVMSASEYKVFEGQPYDLNIVGIRSSNRVAGLFDDLLCCFFVGPQGHWNYFAWPGTTDPGDYWLKNLGREDGTAILKPGQYRSKYAIGKHRNQYTALVQVGTVTVIRDADRDSELDVDSSTETTGVFGINIHRATSKGESKIVGKWSAGCQVFSRAVDFDLFIALCQAAAERWGNRFTYTLLEEADFAPLSSDLEKAEG